MAILIQTTDRMCLACGILSQKFGCIIQFNIIHPYLHGHKRLLLIVVTELAWWTINMIATPLLGSSYARAPETVGKSLCWVPRLLLYPTTFTRNSWSMNNRVFFPTTHVSAWLSSSVSKSPCRDNNVLTQNVGVGCEPCQVNAR